MTESICKSCMYLRHCNMHIPSTIITGCSRYEEKVPITNADRIRSMSDEELAEALYMGCGDRDRNSHTCKISEKYDALEILYMSEEEEDALCIQCWLDWLKQEIE